MWGSFVRAVLRGRHRLSPLTVVGLIGAIVYTIVPIDLIPDVPIVGWIDDLGFWGIVAGILRWERSRYERGLRARAVTGTAEEKPAS